MKMKILAIQLICISTITCASFERTKSEAEFYKHYYNISYNEIWNATLKALDDIGLVAAEKSEERGFIFAKKRPGSPASVPSLEIFLKREKRRVRVDCLPIIIGSRRGNRSLAEWFFDALEKILKL